MQPPVQNSLYVLRARYRRNLEEWMNNSVRLSRCLMDEEVGYSLTGSCLIVDTSEACTIGDSTRVSYEIASENLFI